MKLYDGGRAPNPRRVRMFLAEKGIEVSLVDIDMARMEHRGEEVARHNPLRTLPFLVFDDGTVLSETVAICRYFEELQPEPALLGRGALGKAIVEMWQRRIELGLFYPVAQAFRHIHPAMKQWEVPQVAEWGEANKPKALAFMRLLDAHLARNAFAAGDAFSIADITGLVALDFMKLARLTIPDDCPHVLAWHTTLKARPSAAA